MSGGSSFVVGAELVLSDRASPEMRRLIEQAERLDVLMKQVQLNFDELGLGGAVAKIGREWQDIARISREGVAEVDKAFAGMGTGASTAFSDITKAAGLQFGEIEKAASGSSAEIIKTMGGLTSGSVEALGGIGKAAPDIFAPLTAAASAASREAIASLEGITGAVRASSAEMRALSAASGVSAAGAVAAASQGGGASLSTRTMAAHGTGAAHRAGLHFGGLNSHFGGSHVGLAGDGLIPAVGGIVLLEGLKQGVEAGFDFRHWVSQFQGNGFSPEQIQEAQKAAWANAGVNPNSSATESMKMILEANKMTGNLSESIDLLPTLSLSSVAMQSVKAEDLKSHFNDGTQIFNFAKYLEEVNATANVEDKTPEEHLARTQAYAREAIRTMITSRGVTDGNSLYALSNNSKGASTNWDMQMATAIAPIIGDVMRHSKMGNADYMELKSYQGGHITPDAVEGLMKYGLVKAGRDASQDAKGNWHLKPNSPFAEGIETNIWDWSTRKLAELKANGYDINDQKVMNGFVNAVGSNGSTSNLMRTTFEPGPRALIQKELTQRDKVPMDAATILQNSDSFLKIDALHKKVDDFFTALGGPLVDPAIAGLTKLTTGINTLAQAMEAHPDLTKLGGLGLGVGGLGLLGYGGGRMLGLWGGSGAKLDHAAVALDGSALALKEAAAALAGGHGLPGGTPGGGPGGGPGGTSLGGGRVAMFGLGLGGVVLNAPGLDAAGDREREANSRAFDWMGGAPDALSDLMFGKGRKAGDAIGDLWAKMHSQSAPLPPGRYDYSAPNTDGNALHRNDEMPAGFKKAADAADLTGTKLGALTGTTGLVLTSFDTLRGGSGDLQSHFGTLGYAADAAAAKLMALAGGGLGEGVGGGSGVIQAAYHPGGGLPDDHPLPPLLRGALPRGVRHANFTGPNPYAGGSGGGTFIAPGAEATTAGMRQNNLGNLGFFPGMHYAGLLGPSNARDVDHSIAKFASQEDGIRAAASLALHKYMGGRHSAWDLIAAKGGWTPGSLGPGASVNVSRAMGLTNRDDLHLDDPSHMVDFLAGLAVQEHGGAGHFYSKDRIRAALGHGAPVAGAPPASKTVAPGKPAAKGGMTALNVTVHSHSHLDGRKVAESVSHHQAVAMEHPNAVGGPDTYGSWQGPATPLNDAA